VSKDNVHDAARVATHLMRMLVDYNDKQEDGRYDILLYVRDTHETPGVTVSQKTRKSSTRLNFEDAASCREVLVELTTTLEAQISKNLE
jgi:hypothetical protein